VIQRYSIYVRKAENDGWEEVEHISPVVYSQERRFLWWTWKVWAVHEERSRKLIIRRAKQFIDTYSQVVCTWEDFRYDHYARIVLKCFWKNGESVDAHDWNCMQGT
jgi:hypothetical protein